MTPAELDLARELVSRPWWEWRPGMLVQSSVDLARPPQRIPQQFSVPASSAAWVPDLRDPATQGCLLAMLDPSGMRQAWVDEVVALGWLDEPGGGE